MFGSLFNAAKAAAQSDAGKALINNMINQPPVVSTAGAGGVGGQGAGGAGTGTGGSTVQAGATVRLATVSTSSNTTAQAAGNSGGSGMFGSVFSAISSRVSAVPSYFSNPIEHLSEDRMKKMTKMDSRERVAVYREGTEASPTFRAVRVRTRESVWKEGERARIEKVAEQMNEIDDVDALSPSDLRRVLECVLAHPDWHAVHVAAGCGLTEYLHRVCRERGDRITTLATQGGRLPLHVAVDEKQPQAARVLLKSGCTVAQVDAECRTAVHAAAASSADILADMVSAPDFKASLSRLDGEGRTPLAVAVLETNFESVQILLGVHAPVETANPLLALLQHSDYTDSLDKMLELVLVTHPEVLGQKFSDGSTALHHRMNKEVFLSILRHAHFNAGALDQRDAKGRTAMHVAVRRNDLCAVVALAAYDADIEARDGMAVTPLMAAIEDGLLLVVKGLILLGAVVDAEVIEVAKRSKKRADVEQILRVATCRTSVPTESELAPLEELAMARAVSVIESSGPDSLGPDACLHVLSMDGGGVRGLVLIQILLELEAAGCNLDKLNFVAGTSTGAILAVAIAQGKSLRYTQKLYMRFKDEIFTGSRPYSGEKLEEFLREEFGEEADMASLGDGGKRVMVTTCEGNVVPPVLHLIRSYRVEGEPRLDGEMDEREPVWRAARKSSAAPTYFSAVDGRWMDGGMVANNPCCDALQQIQLIQMAREARGEPPLRLGAVLSIGTGRSPPQKTERVNLQMPSMTDIGQVLGSIAAIQHLGTALIEQVCASDGAAVSRARGWAQSLHAPFFRFSPKMAKDVALDDTKEETLIELLWDTKVYMHSHRQHVDLLAKALQ